jgi:hypothetical protein
MKHIAKAAVFAILTIAVLSCSLAGKLVEKGLDKGLNTQRASSLWTDVPRMDGLNDSPTEDLPMTIKLVLHTFVNMVLNSDKNSKPVSTDWVFYKYNGSETDIANFYTPTKMKSSGSWNLPEGMKSACMDGKEKGLLGDVCLYQKTENGKQQGLIIVALPTKEPGTPVFVYFLRAETEAEPATK